MHKTLLKLLPEVEGISERIIAIFIDVRGFTAFSKKVDSSDVGLYIKKAYLKIINEYFPEASFFKTTGDGLLIIFPDDEKQCKELITKVVETCFKLLTEFKDFLKKDLMINFETPKRIGVGLTRGSACCLQTNDVIVDYSGKTLNLCAKLLDLARPSGIVTDTSFGIEYLNQDLQEKFEKEDTIFLKGIAEKKPIEIYYSKEFTKISSANKHPIHEIKWDAVKDSMKFKIMKKMENFRYILPSRPLNEEKIEVFLRYPMVVNGEIIKKGKQKVFTRSRTKQFGFGYEGDVPFVWLEYQNLWKKMEKQGLADEMDVDIEIIYPRLEK